MSLHEDRLYAQVTRARNTGGQISTRILAFDLATGERPWATAEFSGETFGYRTLTTEDHLLLLGTKADRTGRSALRNLS